MEIFSPHFACKNPHDPKLSHFVDCEAPLISKCIIILCTMKKKMLSVIIVRSTDCQIHSNFRDFKILGKINRRTNEKLYLSYSDSF